MEKSDTFKELSITIFKEGRAWKYNLNNVTYDFKDFCERIKIPRSTLASYRCKFEKDPIRHAEVINTWLWKRHHGIRAKAVVSCINGVRQVVHPNFKVSRRHKSKLKEIPKAKPLARCKPGYDPHDPSTYTFLVNGKYYVGSDKPETVPVRMK
jgi:hypothetical protein